MTATLYPGTGAQPLAPLSPDSVACTFPFRRFRAVYWAIYAPHNAAMVFALETRARKAIATTAIKIQKMGALPRALWNLALSVNQ